MFMTGVNCTLKGVTEGLQNYQHQCFHHQDHQLHVLHCQDHYNLPHLYQQAQKQHYPHQLMVSVS